MGIERGRWDGYVEVRWIDEIGVKIRGCTKFFVSFLFDRGGKFGKSILTKASGRVFLGIQDPEDAASAPSSNQSLVSSNIHPPAPKAFSYCSVWK